MEKQGGNLFSILLSPIIKLSSLLIKMFGVGWKRRDFGRESHLQKITQNLAPKSNCYKILIIKKKIHNF